MLPHLANFPCRYLGEFWGRKKKKKIAQREALVHFVIFFSDFSDVEIKIFLEFYILVPKQKLTSHHGRGEER